MRIRLISHASVIIETGDTAILCDPWLKGKAFNDSWALCPPAAWDDALLDRIQHLWISHEHPDHFHIATLRGLPEAFRKRVEVLYQKNSSQKMWNALRGFGFERLRALPHREVVPLTAGTSVYCYHEAQMNSCLGVMSGGRTVLNVNDSEIRTPDCKLIVSDIGDSDVVLNQFSIAGYSGAPDPEQRLPRAAATILDNMVANHRDLHTRYTVPFASYIYFCTEDNRYINEFANRPADVARRFAQEGLDLAVLHPGDTLDLDDPAAIPASSARALERFATELRFETLPYDRAKRVELPEIEKAFHALSEHVRDKYPVVIRALRPVVIRIPDLDVTVRVRLATDEFAQVEAAPDLEVGSQPLWFAFKFPFGVQTLGVSARGTLRRPSWNWVAHRILFAMNNAEVYLRPRLLFTSETMGYLRERMQGATRQLIRRLSTLRQ